MRGGEPQPARPSGWGNKRPRRSGVLDRWMKILSYLRATAAAGAAATLFALQTGTPVTRLALIAPGDPSDATARMVEMLGLSAKVGDALNYHADYVKPSWARSLKKNDTIGRHIFYSLRTSQR